MNVTSFASASGLRPALAFVGITVVMGVVAGKALRITLASEHGGGPRVVREALPPPDFDIVDREGRTLALSVRQLDLVASPRALWQAHTPRRIADRLALALGDAGRADELLASLLPDAEEGVIRVDPRALLLDEPAWRRFELWTRGRDFDGVPQGPEIQGFWAEQLADGLWQLCWEPEVALSEAQRTSQGGGSSTLVPLYWTRRLADGIARCLWPDEAHDRLSDPAPLEAQRSALWAALLPSAERVVLRGVEGPYARPLLEALEEEGIQRHQLRLAFRHERRYPIRHAFEGPDAFEIVGRWRFVDEPTALSMASRELGLPSPAHCPEPLRPRMQRRARELLDLRHPASGFERLAGELLAGPEWSFLAGEAATYRYRRDRPVHQRARPYYFDETPESETPRVGTTLDAQLQAWSRHLLEEALEDNDAAIAMAMVVELGSGDVLALGGVSRYEIAEFLPTWHVFTPGSTLKSVVMAAAIDQGVVHPSESFFTHNGTYRQPGSRRPPIGEAEGHATGWKTAAEALALSVNAIMVQIGARLPDHTFHRYLSELGYGSLPGVRIGVERAPALPSLPWRWDWTHASISFGHELGVSLWQHGSALATVLSGGEARPLRLLREVRHDGLTHELPRPAGRRVFQASTSRTVREMMELGAREGTGRHLWNREVQAGTPLVMGSKTGTAQKVSTEICLHSELWRNEENLARSRADAPSVTYEEARSRPRERHSNCYTSSICVFGRVPGSEREVMVLVVVDEPRGRQRYGSQVAGPAAMGILKEALGLTENGKQLLPAPPPGTFAESRSTEHNGEDLPWAVEVLPAW